MRAPVCAVTVIENNWLVGYTLAEGHGAEHKSLVYTLCKGDRARLMTREREREKQREDENARLDAESLTRSEIDSLFESA